MKNLLLSAAIGLAAPLAFVSCAPVASNALRHESRPVYGPPETWSSGGHFTGFAPSSPSANGNPSSSAAAPC